MKRLTPASLFLLMLIGVGGLVLAYAGKKLLARTDVVEGPAVDLLPVAVADLTPGTVITEAHLGQARILRERIAPETARTERVLLGRVVKSALRRAEPINMADLYPPGESPALEVTPGMVAATIDLGEAASVAGLRTGQYVNVHFTPSAIDDPQHGPFTMTLLKGVKVLALGSGGYSRSGGNVTLELTPEQSNVMILARDKGQLQFTYTPEGKGNGGVALKDADRATLAEILGLSQPRDESPFVTEIFSGAGRRTQLFQNGRRTDYYGVERFDYNRPAGWQGANSATRWNGDSFGGNSDHASTPPAAPAARPVSTAAIPGGFSAFGSQGSGEGL
ncbi:MAG: Flp pilus assembly protein CpaB [Planctomyces sp.]|nr:Flp pilus assembly protein CpaB [Planctomyces sp.]